MKIDIKRGFSVNLEAKFKKSKCFFDFFMKIIRIKIIIMVALDGIEPPTQGFSILCSTD